MITDSMISSIAYAHECLTNKQSDTVAEIVYQLDNDAEDIGTYLLEEDVLPQNTRGILYEEMLSWFIELCSYIENEMDIPAIISDDLYDQLVEKLINLGGMQQIGAPTSNIVGFTDRPHKYPELRGSLAKVHFLWDKDIPKKDTRKSLEWYLNNTVRQMKQAGIPVQKVPITVDIKYDGVSHIIEGSNLKFDHILTRGDVLNNLGKDLTPLFAKFFPDGHGGIDTDWMIYGMGLPFVNNMIWEKEVEFGIKVETYMNTNKFEQYKSDLGVKRCNRRSAVTSICNQNPSDVIESTHDDRGLSKYLRMQNFQIASNIPLEDKSEVNRDGCEWLSFGKINGHYQYFFTEAVSPIWVDLRNIEEAVTKLGKEIEKTKELARLEYIPCDGAVLTFLDQDIIDLLGRKDNKNMFQVAYKFPAGEEKTIIEGVDFQVGPIAGRLTPVARLKPIVINGNTISNVTVSNKAKLERLHLHVGDEIIIRYDIIPSIFKTENCKESNNPLIEFPTECPICGGKIKDEVCTNQDCPSKIIGHILNYVKRIDIKGGIGLETIVQLVDAGFLKSIGDLYRLYIHRVELCQLPRMGETSVDNILDGISAARVLYPHQILGSIGIPGIGLKTMEKVCRKFDVFGNIDNLSDMSGELCKIPGIGSKSAEVIIEGIQRKMKLIEDICRQVDIRPYDEEKKYEASVYMTHITDDDFAEFLKSKNINVSDNFSKSSVDYLIIPDNLTQKSAKIPKAQKWGMPILTLTDAKEKWGYDTK